MGEDQVDDIIQVRIIETEIQSILQDLGSANVDARDHTSTDDGIGAEVAMIELEEDVFLASAYVVFRRHIRSSESPALYDDQL